MRFTVKKLGPICDAALDLGDLTIVCGKNNTGKSYLTYSLFSFLSFIRDGVKISPPEEDIKTFTEKGKVIIDLMALADSYNGRFKNGNMMSFKEGLPGMFAVNASFVQGAEFGFEADIGVLKEAIINKTITNGWLPVTSTCRIVANKKNGQGTVECRLEHHMLSAVGSLDQQKEDRPSNDVVIRHLQLLVSILLNREVLDPFIITCERTGAAVFRNEFIIYRNLAFNDQESMDRLKDLRERFEFKGYPLPIRKDLDFVLQFDEVAASTSYIAKEHPKIIESLNSIIGGEYAIEKNSNMVKFKPSGKDVSLTLIESSSSVRSLTELNFYLKHKARKGQILMVDEPELNLHPDAQRKLARVFARLINAGIKVFITTHSDYFIREMNALIMMKSLENQKRNEVMTRFSYTNEELLEVKQVKCYIVQEGKTSQMIPDPKCGFPISTFDDTIEQFNELYYSLDL